jgi:LysR family glycine cleavage system transcriptional activator
MARLPLSTLPAFRTAAKLDNLRAAADALHLTHSAVSQQIQVLEQQLGFRLFDRRGRRIALNAAGRALLASVESALATLDDGLNAAAAAAAGTERQLRVTALPSFVQRWLLPRMGRWRERHPDIALEVEASQKIVDLQRDGFHAGIRTGRGQWPGLEAEPLIDSPLIAVAAPAVARRLQGLGEAALANEPLIGDAPSWESWFAAAGVKVRVRPVADFNDGGLMLQAAEHGLGITLAREMFAADALADGRLVRVSPVTLDIAGSRGYFLVYPPALRGWPPLIALRRWLLDELEQAQRQWEALRKSQAREAGATGRAPSRPARPARRPRTAAKQRAPRRR